MKVEKYNCLKAFELILKGDKKSKATVTKFMARLKRRDLQAEIIQKLSDRVMMSDEFELAEQQAQLLGVQYDQEEVEEDLDDKHPIFKLEPSQFSSDIEYTREIIRSVRRTHCIDDQKENMRRDTISSIFTTRNLWPSALSSPLVKQDGSFQDHYYVKAIVPILKQTYTEEFSV